MHHLGNGLELRPTIYELYHHGTKIKLTEKERAILQLLTLRRGTVLTHKEIAQAVWGNVNETPGNIRTVVWRLRKKLPENLIVSASGDGYCIK
jgi:DNA-binding response OmpR family regulator